jgi:hypothetical protein
MSEDRDQPVGMSCARPDYDTEGHHNEGIAGQHCEPLAICGVDGWQAAAKCSIVKAREVVMNKRGTVHELKRSSEGFTERGVIIAIGQRHRQTQLGPNARTTREYRVVNGLGQLWGPALSRCPLNDLHQDPIDPFLQHGHPLNVIFDLHIDC